MPGNYSAEIIHRTNTIPHVGIKVSTSIRLPQDGQKPNFSSLAEALFGAVAVAESTWTEVSLSLPRNY